MAIGYERDLSIDESRLTDNDAQFLDVNEVTTDDKVESNDSEDDVVGRSNEDNDVDQDSEERNESSDGDDSLLMSNYE